MSTRRSRDGRNYVMISVVSERLDIHPQTLRLYERQGLITPTRSAGNTRLYDDETIRRLETILTLTRDLGVNLAGVEVILNMREQMGRMQADMDRLLESLRQEVQDRKAGIERTYALVPMTGGPLAKP